METELPQKDYIPELSEIRMVRRAPASAFVFSSEEDERYIERCLHDVETAFGFRAFPGLPFAHIPDQALIKQFIDWWRTLEPKDAAQKEAHSRLPSAIRLLDTISAWIEERAQRK